MTDILENQMNPVNRDLARSEVLCEKESDALCPGFEVILTQEEADEWGAFAETAISYEDAKQASAEILEAIHDAEFHE